MLNEFNHEQKFFLLPSSAFRILIRIYKILKGVILITEKTLTTGGESLHRPTISNDLSWTEKFPHFYKFFLDLFKILSPFCGWSFRILHFKLYNLISSLAVIFYVLFTRSLSCSFSFFPEF